MAQLASITQTL